MDSVKKTFLPVFFAILSLSLGAQTPVHDPVVAECDGVFYMFSTGRGISVMSSTDRENWSPMQPVFPQGGPTWAEQTVPGFRGHIWAPDIFRHGNLWYLFYSCSSFGKNDSAIGVAVNRTLNPLDKDFGWFDCGEVVRSVGGRDNWNAIDPNAVEDEDGGVWLSFGSFWGGIKMVKLDKTLLRPEFPYQWYPLCRRPEGTAVDTSATDDAVKADPRGKDFDPGNSAVEAPFIIRRGDFYYMFVSYDLCCRGPKSTYRVVCGRSSKVSGPYVDRAGVPMMEGGGTPVVSGNDRYPGVGHCAVLTLPDGSQELFFHAYDRALDYHSVLLTRPLEWDSSGWPSVTL